MKRIAELDSLRGLAAVAILLFHLAPRVLPIGWSAVDFFFVLSGYLITTILLKNRDDPHLFLHFMRAAVVADLADLLPGRSWARRGSGVVFGSVLPANYRLDGLAYYLTYTQNLPLYWGAEPPPFIPKRLSHTWTLAMEEQFYLFWPLVGLPGRAGRGVLLPLALLYLGASVASRSMGCSAGDALLLSRVGDGFARSAACSPGSCSIARPFSRARGMWSRRFLIVAALALAGIALLSTSGRISFGGTTLRVSGDALIFPLCVLYFAVLGLVVLYQGRPFLRPLRFRGLVYLGTISYGLYLYHIPVLYAVEMVFRRFGLKHPFGADRPLYTRRDRAGDHVRGGRPFLDADRAADPGLLEGSVPVPADRGRRQGKRGDDSGRPTGRPYASECPPFLRAASSAARPGHGGGCPPGSGGGHGGRLCLAAAAALAVQLRRASA